MQVGAFAFLRLVASLVRINKSLVRLCDIEMERLEIERARDMPKPINKVGKKTEFEVADIDVLNKNWEDRKYGR